MINSNLKLVINHLPAPFSPEAKTNLLNLYEVLLEDDNDEWPLAQTAQRGA